MFRMKSKWWTERQQKFFLHSKLTVAIICGIATRAARREIRTLRVTPTVKFVYRQTDKHKNEQTQLITLLTHSAWII